MSVASPMRPTQVAGWFSMGESQLLKWNRHGVLSALSFTDSGVCHFDRAWLRKTTDNGEVNRGNVNQSRKSPAAAGLFFDFGDGRSTTPYLSYYSACPTGKYDGKGDGGS